jgi:2-polyprenyl-6-methoxyphenol hydroxylase-like FAD-dependent oxidoreductase
MATDITSTQEQKSAHPILDVQQAACCIVGGGPAGVVLSLLLARQGIKVKLLEAHKDFDRDFRGDTIHPSTMEIMAELGLADRLLELKHTKLHSLNLMTPGGTGFVADLGRLKTRYPFITIMPQVKFLELIVAEAQKYPNFQLVLGANVQELIVGEACSQDLEAGKIAGVRYRGQGGWHEVRAPLVVGADGRHSRIRELCGFQPVGNAPPMDVLWFRLPRYAGEPEGINGRIGKGRLMALLDRSDQWQVAYIFPKGSYQQIRTAGLEVLRQSIVEVVPEFVDRVDQLKDWSQVAFLGVESSRVKRWYRPGVLLIGDAAHVMSPVAGVGINYAVQDAVEAANILSQPLKSGQLQLSHLAAVQRRRELPTQIIQKFQGLVQKQIVTRALTEQPVIIPWFLRLPILRDLPARIIGLGVWPVHVHC